MKKGKEPRGRWIVLVGPDGVGKTTVAKGLLRRLPDGRYGHWIPTELTQSIVEGPPPPDKGAGIDASHGTVTSVLRLARNWARAWLAYLRVIRPAVDHGASVIHDRWLYGYIGQPGPLGYGASTRLAEWALRTAPRPDRVIVLDAPGVVVHTRKAELTVDQVEAERLRWRRLTGIAPTTVVDATQPPDEVADAIVAQL